MIETNSDENTIKRLKIHYFVHVSVAILLFVLVYFRVFAFAELSSSISLYVQQYAIILTLIALPAALKIYSNKIKKIQKTDRNIAIQSFRRIYFTRLYLVGFAVFINVLLYGMTRIQNFAWLAVISMAVYAFCLPSCDDLFQLTRPTSKEEADKTH